MKEYLTWKQYKRLMTCQPYFVWHDLESENEIDENNLNDFWKDETLSDEVKYSEIVNKTTRLIEKKLEELFLARGSKFKKGSTEDVAKFTDDQNAGLILHPTFESEGKIAKPFAYDFDNKVLHYIKYSSKMKLSDALQPFWDFHILKEKGIDVQNVIYHYPADRNDYKKFEIEIASTDYFYTTKTGKRINFDMKTKPIKIIDFINNQNDKKFIKFDDAITSIIEAKNIATFNKDELDKDISFVSDNPFKKELLTAIDPNLGSMSGNAIRAKNIVEKIKGVTPEFSTPVLDALNQYDEVKIFNNELKEIDFIDKAKRVIWYDFEGYSLPIPAMDNVKPYQQIVFQVSIIETTDNKETLKNNIVYDPQNICLDTFVDLITQVYANNADAYVVYNKSYELVRMQEMVNLLFEDGHQKAEECSDMLNTIKNKTIDLMDLFKITSPNNLPLILLPDQNGGYSIKNVEKHITKNKIDVPRPIKEYANLEIKNGGMAMEVGIQRAVGLIGDNAWDAKLQSLKDYCENDVRAMIMVYDFVKILQNK